MVKERNCSVRYERVNRAVIRFNSVREGCECRWISVYADYEPGISHRVDKRRNLNLNVVVNIQGGYSEDKKHLREALHRQRHRGGCYPSRTPPRRPRYPICHHYLHLPFGIHMSVNVDCFFHTLMKRTRGLGYEKTKR